MSGTRGRSGGARKGAGRKALPPEQFANGTYVTETKKNKDSQSRQQTAAENFKPKCIPNTFRIPASVKLCTENTRTGYCTENHQVKYKNQLIDNGNAAHLLCADISHHNIIQHTDKIGDTVLNHNGHCHCQYHLVKFSVTD